MATGTATTVRSARPGRDDQRDRFIQQQVKRAGRQLRLVDLGAALMALISGVLAYLLLLALADHWIWSLGLMGRWIALSLLVVAAGLYTWRYIVPPLIHSVNPLYAARAIENSEASLKNSLVNFLFLRERPDAISGVVLDTLERTAATDLKRVSVDASIDRTKLIRVLYALTAALALFAVYKILSPKDPLQSAYRVLMPWSNVAAASRVSILDVEPGDTTGLLNEQIRVVARVRGVRAGDQVIVLCSSSDQQLVERPVEMTVGADGVTYEAAIPPGPSGLKQDWTYRVQAGDALSPEYRIKLEAKPLISVQRIELEFPGYTERPRQILEGQGDIEALEGTRVTIRAKANREIRAAYVEWDPELFPNRKGASVSAPLDMVSQGTEATAHFVLKMAIDGKTPLHSSYQLRFVADDGQQNVDPIVNRIVVFPDLAPVVEILSPKRRELEVPENGRLPVEVRALDPDFGLSAVKLVGSAGSDKVFTRDLLTATAAYRGQFVAKHELVPREMGLVAGDEFVYRAVARDNRHDPDGSLSPNEQRSADYRIVITPPQETPTSKDPGTRPQPDAPTPDDASVSDERGDEGEVSEKEEEGARESTDSGEGGQESGEKAEGAEQPEAGSEEGEDSQQGAGQEGSDSGQGQQSSSAENQQGSGTTGEPSGDKGEVAGAGESGTGQEGSSQGASEASQGPEGTSSGGDPTPGRGGSSPSASTESDVGEGGEPRSPDDLHDGEIFDIVRKRLEEQSGRTSPPGRESGATETASNDRQPPGESGPSAQDQEGAESANRGEQASPQGDESASGERARAPGQTSPEFGDQRPRESEDVEHEGGIDDQDQAAQDRPQGGAEQGPPGPSKGGHSDGAAKPQDQGDTRTPEGAKDSAQDGAGENGKSGAGTKTDDETGQGTTFPEFENRDRDKTEKPDSAKEEEVSEPSGISASDHQSDSKGDKTSGDQSGGGGQGAGQSAQLPGADSAGSQQAGDEGAGAAQESGAGERSSDAGGKEQAGGRTGTSGSDAGEGSSSRPQPEGGDPGAASSPATPNMAESPASDPSGAGSRQDGTSGIPTGGGIGSEGPRSGSQQPAPPLVREKEQLDYAHRATDLALDHLRNQQQNPDQELLDELGWSREDLAEFVRRWDRLKRASAANPDARRELDESLKSLGLRPPQDTLRRGTTAPDARRGNSDDALRSAPPSKYFEQFNAFRKGAARSSDD